MADLRERFDQHRRSRYVGDGIGREPGSLKWRNREFNSYKTEDDLTDRYYNLANIHDFIASPIRDKSPRYWEHGRYSGGSILGDNGTTIPDKTIANYQTNNTMDSSSLSPIKLVRQQPIGNPSRLFKANSDLNDKKNQYSQDSYVKSSKWGIPILRLIFGTEPSKNDKKSVSFDVGSYNRTIAPENLEPDKVDDAAQEKRQLQDKLEMQRKVHLEAQIRSLNQQLQQLKQENTDTIEDLKRNHQRQIDDMENELKILQNQILMKNNELNHLRQENLRITDNLAHQQNNTISRIESAKTELKRKLKDVELAESRIIKKQRRLDDIENNFLQRQKQLDKREHDLLNREKSVILQEKRVELDLASIATREQQLNQLNHDLELKDSMYRIKLDYFQDCHEIRMQLIQLEEDIILYQNSYLELGGTQYSLSLIQSKKKVYQKISELIDTGFNELANSDLSRFGGYREIFDDLKFKKSATLKEKNQILQEITKNDDRNVEKTRELYIKLLRNLHDLREINEYLINFNELFEKADIVQLNKTTNYLNNP